MSWLFPSFLALFPSFLPFLPDVQGSSKNVWRGGIALQGYDLLLLLSVLLPFLHTCTGAQQVSGEVRQQGLERKGSKVKMISCCLCFLIFFQTWTDMHIWLKNVWWERIAISGLFPSFFTFFPYYRHAQIFGCLKNSGEVLNNWRGIYGNWIIAEITVYDVNNKYNQPHV